MDTEKKKKRPRIQRCKNCGNRLPKEQDPAAPCVDCAFAKPREFRQRNVKNFLMFSLHK